MREFVKDVKAGAISFIVGMVIIVMLVTALVGTVAWNIVNAQANTSVDAIPGADPLPYMVALNYIKALPEITKGEDNKMIILPYEASGVMGSLATIKELFK